MERRQETGNGGFAGRGYSLQPRHMEYIRRVAQQFNPPNQSAALRMIIEEHELLHRARAQAGGGGGGDD